VWAELRQGFVHGCKKGRFRICQFSVQHDHIHLIVEAEDNVALARGMQGFNTRVARGINRACGGRTGTVFADRYASEVLASPRQARNALRYVLLNSRHHQVDLDELHGRIAERHLWTDEYASWSYFDGWSNAPPRRPPPERTELLVAPPQSWLLREGWRRAGAFATTDVPGTRRKSL
jgi:putative transposase